MGKDICLFLNACLHAQSPNRVWLSVTLWTVARQVPLSMGFSRQEYWSGLPFPSPGDLPDPGVEHWPSALAARFFTIWAIREALLTAEVSLGEQQWAPWLYSASHQRTMARVLTDQEVSMPPFTGTSRFFLRANTAWSRPGRAISPLHLILTCPYKTRTQR